MNISIFAWLSSAFLALMVVFDRLMIGDCYRNQPNQAWFISSVGGVALGLFATALAWVFVVNTSPDTSFTGLWSITISLFWPYGLLMVIAGGLTMQVLYYYFQTFIPEDGHAVNEAGIAMWLASSPLWIFATLALLQTAGIQIPLLAGLGNAVISWKFGLLLLLSVIALMQFEKASQGNNTSWSKLLNSRYLRAVLLIQVFTVGYTLVLSGVLRTFHDDLEVTLALLPLYILGFGTGIVHMFVSRTSQIKFRSNWRRLKLFVVPIMLAEIAGIMVFFLEFFALSELDPTLVNLIIGAHVVLVFGLMWILRRLKVRMDRDGVRHYKVCGLPIKAKKISSAPPTLEQIFWLTIGLIALGGCIVLVT